MADDFLPDSHLAQFADQAALEWCGEKERETFSGDVAYFMANWRYFPGFRVRVEALAYRAHHATDATPPSSEPTP